MFVLLCLIIFHLETGLSLAGRRLLVTHVDRATCSHQESWWQDYVSQSSAVWGWFDAWRNRQEPVTIISPRGGGDTPWGTAWPLLRPAATSFSAAPSLTLEVRREKQHLCPHFAHLYRENTWVEGSALLTKPKITRRPSISEERRIIFLLSRAKAGHKLALCKQRQALYSLDNLLQIICPALLINAVKHLEG